MQQRRRGSCSGIVHAPRKVCSRAECPRPRAGRVLILSPTDPFQPRSSGPNQTGGPSQVLELLLSQQRVVLSSVTANCKHCKRKCRLHVAPRCSCFIRRLFLRSLPILQPLDCNLESHKQQLQSHDACRPLLLLRVLRSQNTASSCAWALGVDKCITPKRLSRF